MRVTLDASDLREKGGLFYSTLVQGSKEAVRVQANEAYQRIAKGSYFKNRSGRTLKSFTVAAAGLTSTVTSTYKIAHFLNVGTRAHDIVASKAPMLVFYWAKAGGIVRFKKVRHPGTKPTALVAKETFRGLADLLEKTDATRDKAIDRSGLG